MRCVLVLLAPFLLAADSPSRFVDTRAWTRYHGLDGQLQLSYPANLLAMREDSTGILLWHFTPYRHGDPCDFVGDSPMMDDVVDMALWFELDDRPFRDVIAARHPFMMKGDSIVTDGGDARMVSFEPRAGVRVRTGTHNCGRVEYLLLDGERTLIANRQIVTVFHQSPDRSDTLASLPGIITPEVEEELFRAILMTVSTTRGASVVLGPITASERNDDRVPPSTPEVHVGEVWRGRGDVGLPNGLTAHSSHHEDGGVQLRVGPVTDNHTPPDSLRYRFHVVDGDLPHGLRIPLHVTGEITGLSWHDGGFWTQDAFSFHLAVTAVDNAGNESARSNIVLIADDGSMEEAKNQARNTYGDSVTFIDNPPRVFINDGPFVFTPRKSR